VDHHHPWAKIGRIIITEPDKGKREGEQNIRPLLTNLNLSQHYTLTGLVEKKCRMEGFLNPARRNILSLIACPLVWKPTSLAGLCRFRPHVRLGWMALCTAWSQWS
jgi:hypothetical protein